MDELKMDELKMVFHCEFYDGPLDGLAIYNDEEVYFCEHPAERFVSKKDYTPAIKTKINEMICADNPYDIDNEVGDYIIECNYHSEFMVERQQMYDIYRLPTQLLLDYKTYFMEFSEAVGYHCWHDPQFYRPYVTYDTSAWYNNNNITPQINIQVLEHLGTFRWDKFKYFTRPGY